MIMKNALTALIVWLALAYSTLALAQTSEQIRSDRPGQANSPFTAGQKQLILQTGGTFEGVDFGQQEQDGFVSTTNIRYGLGETFEVRTTFQLRRDKIDGEGIAEQNLGGLSAWDIGLRTNLLSGGDLKPALGVEALLNINATSEDYPQDNLSPTFLVMFEQPINESITFASNLGVSWDGNGNNPTGIYVANLSFPIIGSLGAFIENYGQWFEDDFDTRFDGGFSYLATDDLQLDLSAGLGENDDVSDWFVDLGLSWRIAL